MDTCEHDREGITWETHPEPDGDCLIYKGVCSCGQKVEERYTSAGVFNTDTGDFISD